MQAIEIRCDQLHGTPDNMTSRREEEKKKKKKAAELLMNVFPQWMHWKTAFANWPSAPLVSQNSTSDGTSSTKRRGIVH